MTVEEFATRPDEVAAWTDTGRPQGGRTAGQPVWWRLSLKPYGDALCTPGAAFWIFCARVAIFIMAAAEAVSWSYLGYYIGQSSQPYVTAAIAGLAVFSVIWIIDASFITLDTSRSADESSILGRTSDRRPDRLKLATGLLIRAVIISSTLVISAPFLAQLVFYRDISAEMNRRDANLVAKRRAELAASYDARLSGLLQTRRELDDASIREAAGTGPSRRLGRGPAVATIERRLTDVDAQMDALRSEKAAALSAYDALGRADLQKRYGLQFADDGIRTRGEILTALRANQTYQNAELAIRAFLAFLFLALIVLKLFQPASVAVYFSETLQDLHGQYRAGAFDAWLPPEERSYARAGLTPLRFKSWCIENYRDVRLEEERQRRVASALTIRKSREAELRTMRRHAEEEAAPVRDETNRVLDGLGELHNEAQTLKRELDASREQLAKQEAALELINTTIRSGIGGDTFVRAAEAQAALERDAAQTRATIRAHESSLERLARQAQRQQEVLAELRARLASREALVASVDAQISQLTSDTSAMLSDGGRRELAGGNPPALPA